MKNLSSETIGISLVIACSIFYGLLGYFGTSLIKAGFSIYNMLFWRFFVASCITFIFAFPHLRKTNFLKNNSNEITKALILSALFHSLAACLLFTSALKIGTGLAIVLFFINPVVVMLLNFFFNKKQILKKQIISLVTIISGISLISDFGATSVNFIGVIVGICAAIAYGSYIFSIQRASINAPALVFFITLGCSLGLGITSIVHGSFQIPTTSEIIINIIAIGSLCAAIPMILFIKSLKYITGEKASLIAVSEPLSALFFGYLLLGETIGQTQFIGISLVIFGATLAVTAKNKKDLNHAADVM
jgi:drug/metabolite transporter (DMT)-like permease